VSGCFPCDKPFHSWPISGIITEVRGKVAYTRAQEICQQLGDNLQTFQALWGLRAFYYLRAELQRSLELGATPPPYPTP
jgi:hypothetical protein